jgi:predicted nucleotidyltransferase
MQCYGPDIHLRDTSIAYVNVAAPELAPLFRSDTQGEILARLLLSPDRAYTVAELATMTGTAYASAHREVQRLSRTGLLRERRVGRHHQLSADTSSPAYRPLVELLLLTYGPVSVLPRLLAGVPGIDEAYIYGSWAARRAGEPGSPPGDVDVLLVGDPPRGAVHAAAEQAESELGREVSIRVVSAEAWRTSSDAFLRTVRQRPLTRLRLGADHEVA